MATRDQVHAKAEQVFSRMEIPSDASEEEKKIAFGKAVLKAKALVKREEHAENIAKLVSFVLEFSDTDSAVRKIAETVRNPPKRTREVFERKGRTVVASVVDRVFVTVGDTISEYDLFKTYHMGRGDMLNAIKIALKKASPEDRKWIVADYDSETYRLEAVGPLPPDGYLGYVPASPKAATA